MFSYVVGFEAGLVIVESSFVPDFVEEEGVEENCDDQ